MVWCQEKAADWDHRPEIGKGCDIGYAPATSSCEGANSVDACTVAALDVITAFAVQTPTAPRRVSRIFRVWLLFRLPCRADHSAYFGLAKFYLSQPFQPSTGAKLNVRSSDVNAIYGVNGKYLWVNCGKRARFECCCRSAIKRSLMRAGMELRNPEREENRRDFKSG